MNEQQKEVSAEEAVYPKKRSVLRSVITAAVLVAVILLNVFITVLGDRNLWYVDLSKTRYQNTDATFYSLSSQLTDMLSLDVIPMVKKVNEEREAKGEEPIKVNIVFCEDKDHIEGLDLGKNHSSDNIVGLVAELFAGCKDRDHYLLRYISYTARLLAKEYPDEVSVQYLNVNKNPSSVQKYKTNSAATINDTDVIVEFGSEYLIQGVNSFYYTDSVAYDPWAYNGEKHLAAMILAVTRAEAPLCALTVNHGELIFDEKGEIKPEYSTFIKLIEGAGYEPVILDLEKEEIPENCRMIITVAPTEDFHAFGNLGEHNVSEIEKLDKYLDGSNAFFFVCDPDTPVLPNLEEYLEEWGVSIARTTDGAGRSESYRLEDRVNSTDGKNILLGNYATEGLGAGLTADMRNRSYPPKVIFENSTVIKPSKNYVRSYVAENADEGTAGYTYYSYYKNGVSRSLMDVFTTYDTASATVGGEICEVATEYTLFSLMTVTQELRQIQDGNWSAINNASYVLALASTEFLKNDVLDSTAYGNTDLLLSALRNSGTEAVPADIELKAFYSYDMADEEAYLDTDPEIFVRCLVWIPPILLLALGTVVTVRRKYK